MCTQGRVLVIQISVRIQIMKRRLQLGITRHKNGRSDSIVMYIEQNIFQLGLFILPWFFDDTPRELLVMIIISVLLVIVFLCVYHILLLLHSIKIKYTFPLDSFLTL